MGFDMGDTIDIGYFEPVVTPDENQPVRLILNTIVDVLESIEPRMNDDDIQRLASVNVNGTPLFVTGEDSISIRTLGIIAEFGTLYRESGTIVYGDGSPYLESRDAVLSKLLIQRSNAPVLRHLHDLDGNLLRDDNGLLIPVLFTLSNGSQVNQYITTDNGKEYLFDSNKGFNIAFNELSTFLEAHDEEADFVWSSSSLSAVKAQVDAINDAEVAVEASDEIGWCRNCKSKWLTHALIQTRSGDEALTNKYRCASCRSGKYYLHIYTKEERDAYRARKKLEEEQNKAATMAAGMPQM